MSDKKYIALTYDVKASFFLIGENITPEREEIVKAELEYGCDIENHSLTHSDMREFDADTIKAEIEETTRRIVSITGKEPMFFRPPFINVNDLMFQTCGIACNDWVPEVSAEERARKVIEGAKDGALVLLHDMEGNDNTVEALDIIIPELKKQGYEFVTLRQLFDRAGITPENAKRNLYTYTLEI